MDRKNVYGILNGTKTWPAADMFKRMVERLPETDRTLHVATPNYDLTAEYAFVQAGVPYTTGFWGSVVRKFDWRQAGRQMTYVEKIKIGRAMKNRVRLKKHLRLYKVHGSLNLFRFNGQILETDAWRNVPDGVERIMITPGSSKYEKLHDYRNTLLGEFDKAVNSHNAFLFLGFGFNDTQLVTNTIYEKLSNQSCPGLIITRDSNERIQSLLDNCEKTWLVCKHKDKDNDSTMIYNCTYRNSLNLSGKELWKFDVFTEEIMGG